MVKKNQILYAAISLILERECVSENSDSAFSMIHQCMKFISAENLTEEEKKKKLTGSLQSLWNSKSKRVDGCKREELQNIASLVFGINEHCDRLRNEINSYTFEKLYLYYCYVERIARVNTHFAECAQRIQKDKKDRASEQKQKREIEKQTALEEERKRRAEMSKEEKWKYEISENRRDMDFYRELDNKDRFDAEERREIAQLLMEYWKDIGKWEGDKISKKQTEKIDKIKAVLNGK